MNVMAQEKIRNFDLEVRIFKQLLDSGSVENLVSGLPIPTLIVWGDKDRVLNVASAEMLHKRMPRSRVIIMPDTGHLPMMEQPQLSAKDYIKFRESL